MGESSRCHTAEALADLAERCREGGIDELFLVPVTDDVNQLALAVDALSL